MVLSCHIDSNHSRMQSVSVILNFQCLLVLAAIFVSASNALQCTVCLDRASCSHSPPSQNCTAGLVSLHHRILSFLNPNLDVQSSNVFKCYDLDMYYESSLTGSIVLIVQKGCTSTCNSEDDCNKGQTESPTTTVATTNPLNNSTTTTEASTTTISASVTTTTAAATTTTTTTESTNTTSTPPNSTTTSFSVTTPPQQ